MAHEAPQPTEESSARVAAINRNQIRFLASEGSRMNDTKCMVADLKPSPQR